MIVQNVYHRVLFQHVLETSPLRAGPSFAARDRDREVVAEQLSLPRQQDRHAQDEEDSR